MKCKITALTVLLLFITVLSFGADYYVNSVSGSDSNEGTPVSKAWQTITYALDHVEGSAENPVTIHIAAGTYDWTIGEFFPLVMKNYVNLKGEDQETTIIDASESESSVLTFEDDTSEVVVEGLTITGGGHITSNGGGIYCENSSPDIRNCIITGNIGKNGLGIYCLNSTSLSISGCSITKNVEGNYGGGLYCENSSPVIISCNITENETTGQGAGIHSKNSSLSLSNSLIKDNKSKSYGGGIYLDKSTPVVTECEISTNTGNYGGGIYSTYATAKISNSKIYENTATHNGGGVYLAHGDPAPELTDCDIKYNKANHGGGIAFYFSEPIMSHCMIANNTSNYDAGGIHFDRSSPVLSNCKVTVNTAGRNGGGVYFYNCSPEIGNFTIADNVAESGHAVYSAGSSEATMIDCIVWGAGETELIFKDAQSKVNISYSDVEGGYYGKGNIKDDPLFVTGPLGAYYLSNTGAGQAENSPCIDKGSDTASNLGLDILTTRIDNITDSGQVDIGYHYPLGTPSESVIFGLGIEPQQASYSNGDTFTFMLDITTYSTPVTVDIWLVLFNMDAGSSYFALGWGTAPMPALKKLLLPSGLSIAGAALIPVTLPSTNPPISDAGNYLFAIAAAEPGTLDFVSNIASVNFVVN